MRRILIAGMILLGGAGAALAQDAFGGWWTVTHGRIRQPDGSFRNIAGLKIPYYVTPVGKTRDEVRRLRKTKQLPQFDFLAENPRDTLVQVYNNDRDQYYFSGVLEGPMPSALDDLELHPLAVGNVWTQLKVGWGIPNRSSVFVVFGSYDLYNPNAPAGQSAFSNIIVDTFGGPFDASNTTVFPVVPGDYIITFGQTIQNANIVCPNESIFFFQQFRNVWWEGPFNDDWYMFFSGGGNPQIGMSQDQFWYDFDPQDGIYANEERDVFSTEPVHDFQANFALGIWVDSNITTTDLPASADQIVRGTTVSGNYLGTWSSNNQYQVVNSVNKGADTVYPIGVVYTTFAPNTPLGLTIRVEAKTSDAGHQQRVAMYDYQLGTWVVVNTSTTSTTDQFIEYTAGINPARFADPGTGEMKLRVDYRELPNTTAPFTASIDHVRWRISTN